MSTTTVKQSASRKDTTRQYFDDHERWTLVERSGKVGLRDDKGNLAIRAQYDKIAPFSKNLVQVTVRGKSGLVDRRGTLVVKMLYSHIFHFTDQWDLIQVITGGKVGFVDYTGRTVAEPQFDHATLLAEDLILVRIGGGQGLINCRGQWFLKPLFNEIMDWGNDRIKIMGAGKAGLIDYRGNPVLPLEFDEISYVASEGLIAVRIENKWGYADQYSGKIAIPLQFSGACRFSEGKVRRRARRQVRLYKPERRMDNSATVRWRRSLRKWTGNRGHGRQTGTRWQTWSHRPRGPTSCCHALR